VRVRDALGAAGFTRIMPAGAAGPGPLLIPLVLRDLSPRLELAFAFRARPSAADHDVAITYAVLRSLQIWQVIIEADGAGALPAVAA